MWSTQTWARFLVLPQFLTNFEIQKYYQNEPRFKGAYSQNFLPKSLPNAMKDGASVKNLDENKSIGMHWIALRINGDSATYFDSFGVEHLPEEFKRFISNKNIITSIFRI